MTTRPVAVRVSQATRLEESSARQASRMASEIWSAILSGWPSVTDSEVNKRRFFAAKMYFSLITNSKLPTRNYQLEITNSRSLKVQFWTLVGRDCGNPRGRDERHNQRKSSKKAN